MNRTRLQTAQNLVHTSVEKASCAFEVAVKSAFEASESVEFALFDYVRGVSTATVRYEAKPSRALVSIPLSVPDPPTSGVRLLDVDGKVRPACLRPIGGEAGEANAELLFVENVEDGERKDYRLDFSAGPDRDLAVSLKGGLLENEFITLRFDGAMQVVGFTCRGIEMSDGPFLRSAINYAGRVVEVSRWTVLEREVLGNGLLGYVKVRGEIPFEANGEKRVGVERAYTLASGLPYLYVNTRITYPQTRSNKYNEERARRLEGEYDGHWREVMPCEIRPALFGRRDRPLRVWKHNYLGHVSHYDLDYGAFSKNEALDAFNNHVTHAWVAVTDGDTGLLVAQTADVNACFAFCPMRTRVTSQGVRVFLNPFGCYHGKQLHYATAFSGLGRFIAVKMADSLDSFAPSFNGRSERLAQLIAPYAGDAPPQAIRADAEAFAYPYAVVSRSKAIAPPAHRRWS
jgi:hypothetical protein